MSSVINNDAQSITSSFVTSNFNNPSTANSLDSDDREFNPSVRRYDGLDWKSIPGFQMARHSKLDKRSFVWKHGWEVEETSTGVKFWLCKQCHKENKIKKYNSSTTQNAIAHLKKRIIKSRMKSCQQCWQQSTGLTEHSSRPCIRPVRQAGLTVSVQSVRSRIYLR